MGEGEGELAVFERGGGVGRKGWGGGGLKGQQRLGFSPAAGLALKGR